MRSFKTRRYLTAKCTCLYTFFLSLLIHIPRSNCFGIANCDTDLSWESRDDGSLTVGARRNSTSDAIVLLSVSHMWGAVATLSMIQCGKRVETTYQRIAKLSSRSADYYWEGIHMCHDFYARKKERQRKKVQSV